MPANKSETRVRRGFKRLTQAVLRTGWQIRARAAQQALSLSFFCVCGCGYVSPHGVDLHESIEVDSSEVAKPPSFPLARRHWWTSGR